MHLGGTLLDGTTLDRYGTQLAELGQALTPGGDLLLYGCNVAAGDVGQAFILQLAALTGADVAASENFTGTAVRGGDWVLEAQTGAIEAASLTSAADVLLPEPNRAPTWSNVLVTQPVRQSYPGHSRSEFGNAASFAALRSDGSVVSWGGYSSAVADQIDGATDIVQVYSNRSAFAALHSDGSVVTWGDGRDGGDSTAVAAQIDGTVDVVDIYSTQPAFAALRSDGSVVTWGSGDFGGGSTAVAAQIDGTVDIVDIYSTLGAFAALRSDGSVVTWGYSDYGSDSTAVAAQIDGTVDVVDIYSTSVAFAALRSDGAVVTWGSWISGGEPIVADFDWDSATSARGSSVEAQIDGTVDVIDIYSTGSAFAALRSDGAVVTWGDGPCGGDSTAVAAQIGGTVDVVDIYSTNYSFAALRSNGSVVTWGAADQGGNSSAVSAQINGTIDVVGIYSTARAFAALRSDGAVVTWGSFDHGGYSTAVAAQIDGTVDVVDICSTYNAFAALRTDGSVVVWGGNYGGDSTAVAAQIDGTVDVVDIYSTDSAFAALRSDGSVVTWGYPFNGGDSSAVAAQLTGGVVALADIASDERFFPAAAQLGAIEEDAAAPSGAAVAALLGTRFEDADGNAMAGIAVAGNAAFGVSPGRWQYSTNQGANWFDVGAVSAANALLLDAASPLRFVPNADFNGTPGALTVHAVDNTFALNFTSGSLRQSFDTSAAGAASAVSADGIDLTTRVTPANDLPLGSVTIAGTVAQGQTVAASNTLVDVDGMGTVGYRWQVSSDGSTGWMDLNGATGGSLTLGDAQAGAYVRVVASYTDAERTAESVASAAAAVADLNDAPVGTVTVSGLARPGRILTASNTLADRDGLGTVSYQWQSSTNGTIWTTQGTGSSFALTDATLGKQIRVLANYTDGHGTAESVASAATEPVSGSTLQIGGIADTQDEGTGAAGLTTDYVFSVRRGGDTDLAASATWSLSLPPGGASAGDFAAGQALRGSVAFAAGATLATITIAVVRDDTVEEDETFTVSLSNPSAGTILLARAAAGVIVNDDLGDDDFAGTPGTTGVLVEGPAGVTGVLQQPNGADWFDVMLQQPDVGFLDMLATVFQQPSDADWFAIALAADAAYTFDLVGRAVAAGGEGAYGVADPLLELYDAAGRKLAYDDDSGEGLDARLEYTPSASGTYYLSAGALVGGATGGYQLTALSSGAGGTYTADAVMDFADLDQAVYEGNAADSGGRFEVVVRRDGDTAAQSEVSWRFAAPSYGVAITAVDFAGGSLPAGGTVTFAADETEATITVTVAGDTDFGTGGSDVFSSEFFNLELYNPVGGTLTAGRNLSTYEVMNDDDAEGSGLLLEVGGQVYGAFQPNDVSDRVNVGSLDAGVAYTLYVVSTVGQDMMPTVSTVSGSASTPLTALPTSRGGFNAYALTGDGSLGLDLQVPENFPTGVGALPYAVGVLRSGDDDFAGNRATLGRLMPTRAGGFITGLLNDAEDQDWFQVEMEADQRYSFTLIGNKAIGQGEDSIATLEFRDASGNLVSGADRSRANPFLDSSNFTANADDYSFTAPGSGVFHVALRQSGTDPTPYAMIARNTSATPTVEGALAHIGIVPQSAYGMEPATGSTPYVFTVQRDGDTSVDTSFAWRIAGTTDIAGYRAEARDFANAGGMVSFGVGETEVNLTVLVAADDAQENDEYFAVQLADARGAVIESRYGSAVGLIRQGFGEIGAGDFIRTVGVAAADLALTEGTGEAVAEYVFSLRRSAAPLNGRSERVNWSVAGSGAAPTAAADFAGPTAGTVTFTDSIDEVLVTVIAAPDAITELDENFVFSLSLPAVAANATAANSSSNMPGLRIDAGSVLVRIDDDDEATGFSVAPKMSNDISQADRYEDAGALAGQATFGYTAYAFRVERTADMLDAGIDRVDWQVEAAGGTGFANAADFLGGRLPAGNVSFAGSQGSVSVTVFVSADAQVEGDESFALRLTQAYRGSTAVRGSISTANRATGMIRNDDSETPQVRIGALNAVRAEGSSRAAGAATPFTFLVSRQGNLAAASTVNWLYEAQSQSGSAPTVTPEPQANDFVGNATGGTVSFAAGQSTATLTVRVAPDSGAEGDEAFAIQLSGGANVDIVANRADAVILNDDAVTSYADFAGDTMDAAAPALAPQDLGTLAPGNRYSFSDYIWSATDVDGNVTAGDTDDWYRLRLPDMASIRTLQIDFADPNGVLAAAQHTPGEQNYVPAQQAPDLDIALYDAGGRQLAQAANSSFAVAGSENLNAVGTGATTQYRIGNLPGGEYFVRVQGFRPNAEAGYTLQVQTDALPDTAGNAMSAGARRIALDGANAVAIREPLTRDDFDFYTFTTTTPTAFRAGIAGAGGNVDLRLMNATGEVLRSSANAGSADESIAYTEEAPLPAGTYYLWAYSPAGDSTIYDLTVSAPAAYDDAASWDSVALAGAPSASLAADVLWAPLAAGAPAWTAATLRPTLGTAALRREGAVNGVDREDYWTFALANRGSVVIDLARTAGAGNLGNADMQLMSASGETITVGREGANGAESLRSDELAAGTYVVRVGQYSGATRYSLSMRAEVPVRADRPGESTRDARDIGVLRGLTRTFSESVGYQRRANNGSLAADPADWYKFTAGPGGGTLNVDLSGLSAAAWLRLLDQNGVEIANSGNDANVDEETLSVGGVQASAVRYVVVENAADASPSGYNLSMAVTPDDTAGNTLAAARSLGRVGIAAAAAGTPTRVVAVSDFVGIEDEADVYRLSVPHLSNLRVSLGNGGTAAAPGALQGDADLELLDSQGTVLARSARSGNAAERIVFDNLPANNEASPSYYLRVARYAGAVSDTLYTLSVDAQAVADAAGRTAATARAMTLTGADQRFGDWLGVVPYAAPSDFGPDNVLAAGAQLAASEVDDFDYYRFSLAVPSVVEYAVDRAALALDVLTAAGAPAPDGDAAAGSATLPAGSYLLRVGRNGATDAAYTLTAAARPQAPVDNGGELAAPNTAAFAGLAVGRTLTANERLGLARGTTANSQRDDTVDAYRVTVPANQRWELAATLAGLEANLDLQLWSAAGTQIVASAGTGSADEALGTVAGPGSYVLRVVSADGTRVESAYALTLAAATADDRPDSVAAYADYDIDAATAGLQRSDIATPTGAVSQATNATNPTRVRGVIESEGDVDLVRLAIAAGDVGQTFTIRALGQGAARLADPLIAGVYDAAGTLLPNSSNHNSTDPANPGGAAVAFRPQAAGDYFIAASGNGTGGYELSVARTNQRPQVTNPIVNQVATEGQAFAYRLPWNVFGDAEDDALALRATLAVPQPAGQSAHSLTTVYGRELPPWLAFEAGDMTLTGTAPAGAADLALRVVARDAGVDGVAGNADDGFAFTDFALATPAIADDFAAELGGDLGQVAAGGAARGAIEAPYDTDWFAVDLSAQRSYTFDVRGAAAGAGSLTDPSLRGIFRRNGNRAELLPGTANNDAAGTLDARLAGYVPAADGTYYLAVGGTGEGSGSYTVAVVEAAANRAPVLNDQDGGRPGAQGIGEVLVREGTPLRYEVPQDLFADADGDRLALSMTLSGGAPLPAWLRFDAATRVLSSVANVPAGDDLSVRVTATDPSGFAASDVFALRTDAANPTPAAAWTVMVYMAADNNLEEAALDDINEMEEALRRNVAGLANVNVVVQVDRAPGYASGDGNWTDTRRGRLTADTNPNAVGSRLVSVGEKNMGDAGTLTEFVNWTSSNYRAEHYALVIWDHGGGLGGSCWDDSSGRANLSVVETTQALAATTLGRVDVLGFDTCLSGMVEQAYDLRVGSGDAVTTLADYVVASEDYEPGDGWDYRHWLRSVDGGAEPRRWAGAAVTSYGNAYNNEKSLSAVATDHLDELAGAIAGFVEAVRDDADGISARERGALRSARGAAATFYDRGVALDGNRDLGGFMGAIAASSQLNAPIRTAAQTVMDALDAAVVAATDVPSLSGLSIYAPRSAPAANAADYSSGSFRFVADSRWNEFLTIMNG